MRKFIRFNNRPPHIYLDNSYYFITARTVNKQRYYNTSQKKQIFEQVLIEAKKRFGVSLLAWIILDNHYHLLVRLTQGENLSLFIKNLHNNSSRLLNQLEGKPGRKIWFQYWDKCIRTKEDFWKHFNYIHHNPVKHGSVKSIKELSNYRFSSFNVYLKKFREEWLTSCFEQYPIIDFTEESDSF